MQIRPITKSSHELLLEVSGRDPVRVLFSFVFPVAIEARGRVAVLAEAERTAPDEKTGEVRRLVTIDQHIAKWLKMRLHEGLPALPETGPVQMSKPEISAAITSLLSTLYGK